MKNQKKTLNRKEFMGLAGVKATFGGKLYVDKKAFFKRAEVRKVLEDVMRSEELKSHLSAK